MTPPYQQIAEAMFNAYNAEGPNPWKTFDGRDVPRWPELNDQVRGKWVAAAALAGELLTGTKLPMTYAESVKALDADIEAKKKSGA